MFYTVLRSASLAAGTVGLLYLCMLGLLTTPWFQSHAVYLHAFQLTWFKDLNVPEMFGFLHNQVTPFEIQSISGENLHAWHIMPMGAYLKNEKNLNDEPSGLARDITSRLAFKLLQSDPDAQLVIHLHGAGGTVGSGHRIPNYRALSAGDPDHVHVLTFDYRGFGRSTGTPSERGVILDAVSVVEWVMNVARIPPSRILIYGQSLGTAVNMAVAEHFAQLEPPTIFAGHLLTAPFVDTSTLVRTYSIAATVPVLGPLARFPLLFEYFRKFIRDEWLTSDRMTAYVKAAEASGHSYRITIVHAEDDVDIPWMHSSLLFWHAVNGCSPRNLSYEELDGLKLKLRTDLGSAGSVVEWKTDHGVVREEILKYGLHDVIMGNPVVSLAVMRIFQGND